MDALLLALESYITCLAIVFGGLCCLPGHCLRRGVLHAVLQPFSRFHWLQVPVGELVIRTETVLSYQRLADELCQTK